MEHRGPANDPRVIAEAANADGPLAKGMAFFSVRLLRKAYRPGRRGPSCPADVKESEAAFLNFLQTVKDDQPHLRSKWHSACESFSKEWAHVCHWIHPVRLADYLSEQLGFKWTGENPPRRTEDVKEQRAAVRAQKFRCVCCNVTCNSYTQYEIHAQGTKHIDLVNQRKRAATAQGRAFQESDVAPIPVGDGAGDIDPQMCYYHKSTEGEKDGLSSSSTGSLTPPVSPKKKRLSGNVSPRLAAHLAVATSAIAGVGGTVPSYSYSSTGPAEGWYQEPSNWAYYGGWQESYPFNEAGAAAWEHAHSEQGQCFADWNQPDRCIYVGEIEEEEEEEEGDCRAVRSFPRSPYMQSTWASDQVIPPVASEPSGYSIRPPTYYDPEQSQYDTQCQYWGGPGVCGAWRDGELDLASGSAPESTVLHAASESEEPSVKTPLLSYLAHEGIERALVHDVPAQDEVLKVASEEGVRVAARGLVHAAAGGKVKEVAGLLRELGHKDISQAVAEETSEMVGLGPQVRQLHEDMGEEESECAEQANGRELLRYAGVVALGVLLACTESGGLGLMEAGVLLRKYVSECEAAGVDVPKCATSVAVDAVWELSSALEAQGSEAEEPLELVRELRAAHKECPEQRLRRALSDAADKAYAPARFLMPSFTV